MERSITEGGLKLIKKYEGLRLEAYLCPANVWTIGYGHTQGVKEGLTINKDTAEDLLLEDLRPIEKALNRMQLDINQGQFNALCSFIFNLGIGNFASSTLLKTIRENPNNASILMPGEPYLKELGLMTIIKYNFLRWCKVDGKVYNSLIKRRHEEYTLYNFGIIID